MEGWLDDLIEQIVQSAFFSSALVRLIDDDQIKGAQPQSHRAFQPYAQGLCTAVLRGIECRRPGGVPGQFLYEKSRGGCVRHLFQCRDDALGGQLDVLILGHRAVTVASRPSVLALSPLGIEFREQEPAPGLASCPQSPVAEDMGDKQHLFIQPELPFFFLPFTQVLQETAQERRRHDAHMAQFLLPLVA